MIARSENTNILAEIWLNASLDAHPFVEEAYWTSNFEAMKNIYLCQTTNYVYLDDMSREVLGFVSLNNQHIEALFVDQNHQRRGIGRQLLDFVKSNNKTVTLCVYEENQDAVRFYKDNGFIILDRRLDDNTGHYEYFMIWDDE